MIDADEWYFSLSVIYEILSASVISPLLSAADQLVESWIIFYLALQHHLSFRSSNLIFRSEVQSSSKCRNIINGCVDVPFIKRYEASETSNKVIPAKIVFKYMKT